MSTLKYDPIEAAQELEGDRQVHIRCPKGLWKRFRRRFPEQGDITRVWVWAMKEYLDRVEKHDKERGLK